MTDPPTAQAEDERTLIAWLQTHDAACPGCGYGLRGLTTVTCPECATHLALTVGAPSVRLGAWLLGVVSLALGLGFDAVGAIILALEAAVFGVPLGAWQVFVVVGGLLLAGCVCAVLLWLLIRRRPRFLARLPADQWREGVWWFIGVGVGHALVGVGLFELLI